MLRQGRKYYTAEQQTSWTVALLMLMRHLSSLLLSRVRYLWDRAVKRLSKDDRRQVDFSRRNKGEAFSELLVYVEEEKTPMKERKWKLGQGSDWEPIVL